jgi:membrane-bound lytic murein transglycosylase D
MIAGCASSPSSLTDTAATATPAARLSPPTVSAPPAPPAPAPAVAAKPAVTAVVPPIASPADTILFQLTGPNPLINEPHVDLWSRMRAGFAMPELDTQLVAEKERFYLSNREALNRMFTRGGRYLYYIVSEVERRGMPMEIALLPFVESAMNPVALSSAKAAGLWQFIPSTGRDYNLSQNWWVDNRRDVVQSTRAALDYLQKIYEMNERDWFLALASYNWGENAVARAVKNNRARGLPVDYLSLNMPAETRHYVPKLIALKHIVMRANELGIALPNVPNTPYFATIEKTRPIDLKLAAQFAGMSVEEFVALNPAHNRPVIAASRNNQIKIPADRVDAFSASVARHDLENKPLASWQPYTIKHGESLEDVARRSNVTSHDIIKANGIRAGARPLPGTQLIAPQAMVQDERQIESFQGPKVVEQVSMPAVYHRVGKRESLGSIAGSYGVSAASLTQWNGGIKSARAGTSLLVRPATHQTVVTNPGGDRQVVARGPAEAPAAAAPASTPAAAPMAVAAAGTVATAATMASVSAPARPAPDARASAPAMRPAPPARAQPAKSAKSARSSPGAKHAPAVASTTRPAAKTVKVASSRPTSGNATKPAAAPKAAVAPATKPAAAPVKSASKPGSKSTRT